MQKVYYVGYYDGVICSEKRRTQHNIAGTEYMNGLIRILKKIKFHVSVVSLQGPCVAGYYSFEKVAVDEYEDQIFLPYFCIKLRDRLAGGRFVLRSLKKFIKNNVTSKDIVISYHSLAYKDLLSDLHKTIGFTWIPEINEIYSLSQKDYEKAEYLTTEIQMFQGGDGYIFASDVLAAKYSCGKPYAVVYGNYEVEEIEKTLPGDSVNITYTGIINEDRGVFKLLEAMRKLPLKYKLHILGFGEPQQIERLLENIRQINEDMQEERIFYYGTKVGKAYTEFLQDKHIGISLMDMGTNISDNAFPGKLLSYMRHSLYVVSSPCESILKSKLESEIFFCDKDFANIAESIQKVPVEKKCHSDILLNELEDELELELKKLLLRACEEK